ILLSRSNGVDHGIAGTLEVQLILGWKEQRGGNDQADDRNSAAFFDGRELQCDPLRESARRPPSLRVVFEKLCFGNFDDHLFKDREVFEDFKWNGMPFEALPNEARPQERFCCHSVTPCPDLPKIESSNTSVSSSSTTRISASVRYYRGRQDASAA